ncbi:hypothetical protein [Sphingopyxis macrogoltabida]|uniref:Uncharacterized protein n=1 Tax=Sphingopyxis macrogoltabida TaxID=33050 RepID=A0AAC8Z2P8_SPHMC|nr:hypothetical protein [Sphingopyxis macrogoltabida]ALJ14556.1 hypothetical protein LH19_16920 [Sphingopyxis macrogoltabida]AMU90818.1 hypothetical protein ATM17_17490 [Sphingopyxis macrogoltabida]
MGGRTIAALLMLASPSVAMAQDAAADDGAAMKALEADVPQQPWYPGGYYDIRIAAEAQVVEFPRPASDLPATPEQSYNLVACDVERPGNDASDPMLERYGYVALETARLRAELRRMHYPASIYAEPLLAFERESIARAEERATNGDPYTSLAEALEAARAGAKAPLSPVFEYRDCTPPPMAAPSRPRLGAVRSPPAPGVKFRTEPPAGELWMISAFAFKVCVRKQPDPWDRFACKWNEVETGVTRNISGRFVYQVRWPDGTVRKGTREVAPASGSTPVTFKKVGS